MKDQIIVKVCYQRYYTRMQKQKQSEVDHVFILPEYVELGWIPEEQTALHILGFDI